MQQENELSFLWIVVLLASALSGCSSNDHGAMSYSILVELLEPTAEPVLEWNRLPADQRAAELPPLFREAQGQHFGRASEGITQDRWEEIRNILSDGWRTQHGAAERRHPDEFLISYEGEIFSVILATAG